MSQQIFGIWVYYDELQIKCTFRSGPMIFDRDMPLGLWNLAKYLVVYSRKQILIWSGIYSTCIWIRSPIPIKHYLLIVIEFFAKLKVSCGLSNNNRVHRHRKQYLSFGHWQACQRSTKFKLYGKSWHLEREIIWPRDI
jgi:hypothetical protein